MPMLANDDRIVGTDGFITYEDPDSERFAEPFEIPITSWVARGIKSFQDTTSSRNYDPKSDLIHPTRVQVAVVTEAMIAGRFRMARVPMTFVAAMYSGDVIPKIRLNFSRNREYGNGFFTVSEFEASSPIDDVVNYSCKIESYGVFEPNLNSYEISSEAIPGAPFNPGA